MHNLGTYVGSDYANCLHNGKFTNIYSYPPYCFN